MKIAGYDHKRIRFIDRAAKELYWNETCNTWLAGDAAGTCLYCLHEIDEGQSVGLGLFNDAGSWSRVWMHAACAERGGLRGNWNEAVAAIRCRHSARTMLLLEALGLPRDLAWPIAAITYWLL